MKNSSSDSPRLPWWRRLMQRGPFLAPSRADEATSTEEQIYCFKCRARTGTSDPRAVTLANGSPATQGMCVDCGTRKFRIGRRPEP